MDVFHEENPSLCVLRVPVLKFFSSQDYFANLICKSQCLSLSVSYRTSKDSNCHEDEYLHIHLQQPLYDRSGVNNVAFMVASAPVSSSHQRRHQLHVLHLHLNPLRVSVVLGASFRHSRTRAPPRCCERREYVAKEVNFDVVAHW